MMARGSDFIPMMSCLFAAFPGLESHLIAAKLSGPIPEFASHDPMVMFRQALLRLAIPNSLWLVHSPEGGETVAKTEIIRKLLAPILEAERPFATHMWHLMCYAGTDDRGNAVLLNVPKPVFGTKSCSPLLLKTGNDGGEDEHLVLNKPKAAEFAGGFDPLTNDALQALTGTVQHGVNLLLRGDSYDANVDLRIMFCDSLTELYWASAGAEVQLVEVLVGGGQEYSVVMPLEVLLAFLLEMKACYPHLELQRAGVASEEMIGTAVEVLMTLVSRESLVQAFPYNGKRPFAATFGAIVRGLTKALRSQAPFIADQTAKGLAENFVRHFFSVEHDLLCQALAAEDDCQLQEVFDRLSRTEYGVILAPVASFDEFKTAVLAQRKMRQDEPSFEFSNETAKSDLYLTWLQRMAATLKYHVVAATRSMDRDLEQVLEGILKRVIDDCAQHFPSANPESVRNAAQAFVDIVFQQHRLLAAKIKAKRQAVIKPEQVGSSVDFAFWQFVHQETLAMLRETQVGFRPDSEQRVEEELIRRAVAPELSILETLPFARQLRPVIVG